MTNQVEEEGSISKSLLPPEILIQIFSRLPMRSICLVRRVSKTWYNMITDLFSAKLFNVKALSTNLVILGNRCDHGHYPVVPTTWNLFMAEFFVTGDYGRGTSLEAYDLGSEYDPVASCNSLVLLMADRYQVHPLAYWVCNPIIGQYMKLPFPKDLDGRRYFSGFGFCRSTKQYKVIQFHYRNGMSTLVEVHVLGTYTWTYTQIIVPEHLSRHLWSPSFVGTYLNGALYWMVLKKTEDVFLYRFDLKTEQFSSIDAPEYKVREEAFLGATAGGQLYISVNSCGVIDLLVMEDFKSPCSWRKVLSMSIPLRERKLKGAIEVMNYTDGTDIIVLGCYDNESHMFYLVARKLEADGGRTLIGLEKISSSHRPFTYIPNFSSLSDAVTGSVYQISFKDRSKKFAVDNFDHMQ